MGIEEVIDNLNYLISGDCTDTQMDYVKEIEFAIEALERQIPKKPVKNKYWDAYNCPCCDTLFCKTDWITYCFHCGQKFDWSDYDEQS